MIKKERRGGGGGGGASSCCGRKGGGGIKVIGKGEKGKEDYLLLAYITDPDWTGEERGK